MVSEQLVNDCALYLSVCLLRKLRDKELLSAEEYARIRNLSREHHGSKIIVL